MKISIILIGILILACGNIFGQKNEPDIKEVYVCSPCGGSCDTLAFSNPGKCPHCAMPLVKSTSQRTGNGIEKLSICFYLQDNVEILDFAGPLEVFSMAGFNVFIVSKTKDKIVSQGSLSIIPDYSIENAPESDVMVFFGGAHSKPANDTSVIKWIQSRKGKTKYYISVCTGAFILGKAGILDNLTATTYHTRISELQKALPKTNVIADVRFVDNGSVITTAGISAGIDGALHFISKIKGAEFAKTIAENIEYDNWKPNNGLILSKKP